MPEPQMSPEDARRSRMLCYAAAVLFAGCGTLLLATSLALPLRAVGAGFNLIIAVAILLYARTLGPTP